MRASGTVSYKDGGVLVIKWSEHRVGDTGEVVT